GPERVGGSRRSSTGRRRTRGGDRRPPLRAAPPSTHRTQRRPGRAGGTDRSGGATMTSSRREHGFVATPALLLLWVGLLLAIAMVDVGGYLVAAGRAQGAADATVLAAVAAGIAGADPVSAAVTVAAANDARLERCTCGRDRAL